MRRRRLQNPLGVPTAADRAVRHGAARANRERGNDLVDHDRQVPFSHGASHLVCRAAGRPARRRMNGRGTVRCPGRRGARRAPPAGPRSETDTDPTASVPRSQSVQRADHDHLALGQVGVLAQVARDEDAPLAIELHLDRPRAHEAAELSCGRVGRRQPLDAGRQLLPGVRRKDGQAAIQPAPALHPAPAAGGTGPGPPRDPDRPERV